MNTMISRFLMSAAIWTKPSTCMAVRRKTWCSDAPIIYTLNWLISSARNCWWLKSMKITFCATLTFRFPRRSTAGSLPLMVRSRSFHRIAPVSSSGRCAKDWLLSIRGWNKKEYDVRYISSQTFRVLIKEMYINE